MITGKQSATFKRKKRTEASAARPGRSHDDTPERILATATRLFADKGYEGTSVKDICDAARVNIASIHYHFGSKESLYRGIIRQFAAERLDFATRILQDPKNVDDFRVRLEIFLSQTLETLIRQKDIVRLIQSDIEMVTLKKKEMHLNPLFKHARKLMDFFEHARKRGIVSADIKAFSAAGFLMSNLIHQTRNDRLVKKFLGRSLSDEKYRTYWVQQTLRIFTDGIIARKVQTGGDRSWQN